MTLRPRCSRLTFRPRFCNSSTSPRNQLEKKHGGRRARLFVKNVDAVLVVIVIATRDAIFAKIYKEVIKTCKAPHFGIYGRLFVPWGVFFEVCRRQRRAWAWPGPGPGPRAEHRPIWAHSCVRAKRGMPHWLHRRIWESGSMPHDPINPYNTSNSYCNCNWLTDITVNNHSTSECCKVIKRNL